MAAIGIRATTKVTAIADRVPRRRRPANHKPASAATPTMATSATTDPTKNAIACQRLVTCSTDRNPPVKYERFLCNSAASATVAASAARSTGGAQTPAQRRWAEDTLPDLARRLQESVDGGKQDTGGRVLRHRSAPGGLEIACEQQRHGPTRREEQLSCRTHLEGDG